MRHLVVVGLALALSACGSGGINPIVKKGLDQINPFKDDPEPSSRPRGSGLSREKLEAQGIPVIRASLIGESGRNTLRAATANSGRVTHISQLGQSVTLQGAQIVATRGLGFDLLSVATQPFDPIAYPRPLLEWPVAVSRRYELPGTGVSGQIAAAVCTFTAGDASSVTILGKQHDGVLITESCATPDGLDFENLHLVEAETGSIWRSIQWIGPSMAQIDIQIVIPFVEEPEVPEDAPEENG